MYSDVDFQLDANHVVVFLCMREHVRTSKANHDSGKKWIYTNNLDYNCGINGLSSVIVKNFDMIYSQSYNRLHTDNNTSDRCSTIVLEVIQPINIHICSKALWLLSRVLR